MYRQDKSNGKEKEFLSYMKMVGTQETKKELEEAHSETLKMPKHPLNSENGKIFSNEVFLFNLNKVKIYNVKSGQYSIEIKENAFPIFGKNDIYLDPMDKSLSFSDFPNNFMSNESDTFGWKDYKDLIQTESNFE